MMMPWLTRRGEGPGTFAHGIHPPQNKHFSNTRSIEVIPTPRRVVLPLQQNIGGPCTPVVKPRQAVAWGEPVGRGEAFVSSPLHAPVSGKVERMAMATLANGRHMQAIVIQAEGDQIQGQALWDRLLGGAWPKDCIGIYDPQEIHEAILAAGIVGLGGAAFPTHVKITPNTKKPIHTLLVNGCECEPYLTADDRLMREAPDAIVTGAFLAGYAVGAERIYIGVEDNKPQALDILRQAVGRTGIQVKALKTKYPQGSEKHLIQSVLGRQVPLGGLPADVGVAIGNVGTMAAVAAAVVRGMPLTHRVVCVTGAGVAEPKNLLVPIGISVGELIDHCGGLTSDAVRIVSGGPMMGFAVADRATPVTKGTSGITVLTGGDVCRTRGSACVRCGRCVEACPMRLVPAKLAQAARAEDIRLARRYNIMACFECGSCAYTCPARIPLVQWIRAGKAMVVKNNGR
jgi:electron transport complex protein RnfC